MLSMDFYVCTMWCDSVNIVVILTCFVASVMLSLWINDFYSYIAIAKRIMLIFVKVLYKSPSLWLLLALAIMCPTSDMERRRLERELVEFLHNCWNSHAGQGCCGVMSWHVGHTWLVTWQFVFWQFNFKVILNRSSNGEQSIIMLWALCWHVDHFILFILWIRMPEREGERGEREREREIVCVRENLFSC